MGKSKRTRNISIASAPYLLDSLSAVLGAKEQKTPLLVKLGRVLLRYKRGIALLLHGLMYVVCLTQDVVVDLARALHTTVVRQLAVTRD